MRQYILAKYRRKIHLSTSKKLRRMVFALGLMHRVLKINLIYKYGV